MPQAKLDQSIKIEILINCSVYLKSGLTEDNLSAASLFASLSESVTLCREITLTQVIIITLSISTLGLVAPKMGN